MNATLKGIITVAAFSMATACGDAMPTAPVTEAPEAPVMAKPSSGNLTFTNTQSYSEEQAFSATGGTGRINFTGSIFTGTPCYNVTGAAQTGTGVVTLTVTTQPNGSSCIQVVTYNNYSGAVTGLAAGAYTFNIVHNNSGTVYSQAVTVS